MSVSSRGPSSREQVRAEVADDGRARARRSSAPTSAGRTTARCESSDPEEPRNHDADSAGRIAHALDEPGSRPSTWTGPVRSSRIRRCIRTRRLRAEEDGDRGVHRDPREDTAEARRLRGLRPRGSARGALNPPVCRWRPLVAVAAERVVRFIRGRRSASGNRTIRDAARIVTSGIYTPHRQRSHRCASLFAFFFRARCGLSARRRLSTRHSSDARRARTKPVHIGADSGGADRGREPLRAVRRSFERSQRASTPRARDVDLDSGCPDGRTWVVPARSVLASGLRDGTHHDDIVAGDGSRRTGRSKRRF